ncbi:hypothetical protein EYF80_032671 [Liparis tanakae]|uniref:Uncharacterized protein n=1 Tax=Liparis tanakae TaxID=230148 RepID=A0A4Z2GU79_9TELE|nr:hypothetical protein EYF80_032671 [Liparis tanakae]
MTSLKPKHGGDVYSTSEALLSEEAGLPPLTRMYCTLRAAEEEEEEKAPQEQSGPVNRFSTSSSARPRVSGRQPRTKSSPRATRPAYMKNAPGGGGGL